MSRHTAYHEIRRIEASAASQDDEIAALESALAAPSTITGLDRLCTESELRAHRYFAGAFRNQAAILRARQAEKIGRAA